MATRPPSAPPSLARPGFRVAVGGSPHFGRQIAGLLAGGGWQAPYLETRGWRPDAALRALLAARSADALYLVGGQLARGSRPHALRLLVRRPLVMHWTGTDILYARRATRRGPVAGLLRTGCTHWTGAPWHVDELAAIGVRAMWMPHSAVDAPVHAAPFPDRFTILSYLRPGRERFYGWEAVRTVALAMPEARVLVAGVERLRDAPGNVQPLGWVGDMGAVYADCHALLRLPRHDGLSFMVQEALAHGRYAVWNHVFPGVDYAAEAHGALAAMGKLKEQHESGRLPLNEAGAAYVRERFNPDRIRAGLREGLAAVIGGRR